MSRNWGEKLTESISILTLGAGLLALFLGVNNWWIIFVVGWLVLTPLAEILFDVDEEESSLEPPEPRMPDERQSADDERTEDALETLRDRYARGELTEEQFERKVERLLATETVEDARDRVVEDDPAGDRERTPAAERESERDRAGEAAAERERES